MSASSKTMDHSEIRKWAEARGGRPSVVRTGGGKGKNKSGGVLRIDFGPKEETFEEISWDEFFEIFDQSHVSFLHQDQTKDGKGSRFNKFVERSPEEDKAAGKKGGGKKAAAKSAAASAKSSDSKAADKKSKAAKPVSAKSGGSSGETEGKAGRKADAKAAKSSAKSESKNASKASGTKSSGSKSSKAKAE
ncbi:MAG: hypothetical protein JWQ36_3073 [Enterovirga sp.]|jgi:hypothetical protein|nr:hypothetical protein [Enterovirga sp.]